MKKLLPILMAFAMTAVSLTGCASGSKTAETPPAAHRPYRPNHRKALTLRHLLRKQLPKTFLPKTLQTALRITPKALSV